VPKKSLSAPTVYDNQTLVIGGTGRRGEIKLLDLQSNTIGKPFQEPGNTPFGSVGSIAVSPDGKTIIAGTDDPGVQLWDQQGKPIGQPFPNSSKPFSVAFSSDGQYVVTGHGDNTVRLWDNQGNLMGEPLQISEDQGAVNSVAISRNGQYIVSGSDDGTVRLWRAGNWQTWLQIACNRLQHHPVLNDSSYLDGNENEVNRGARATCQKYWKNAPSPAPSSNNGQDTPSSSVPANAAARPQNAPSPTPPSNNGQNSYRQAPSDRNQASKLNSVDTYINQGLTYHRQRNYQQAISNYSQAIALNPNSDKAYSNRAAAYNEQKDYQKAIADSSKAISLNPTYANAYINRGLAYYYQGNSQQAIANYNKAIQLAPSNANAYNNRALAYTRLGNQQAVQADKRKAAALSQRQLR
jgi:tetratricopeptide (TPR) repeat protein